MLVMINSFSRVSAPRSDEARGNDRSSKVRTGLGVDCKVMIKMKLLGHINAKQELHESMK